MTLNKKSYKGTRDFFPKLKRNQNYCFSKMTEVAELFGYEPYDGPLLEEVELYKAKSGEELIDQQIYSFTDRGNREVAIRPEMTPTLARMVAQICKEVPRPIRWYSIPNLMRYERPQKGRLREHWQFNVDIFGAKNDFAELEIIQMAIMLFNNFGADENHFEILVNNRIIIDFVFNDLMTLNKNDSYKLYKIIDQSKKVGPDKFKILLDELGLPNDAKAIFTNYLKINSFQELIIFLKNHNFEFTKWDAENFYQNLKDLKIDQYINFDTSIVRGLDYYTGLVFEIFDKAPNNNRALCGGGVYDNLLQIFNEAQMTGVGFGLGDVTLNHFLENHNLLPDFTDPINDILLTYQNAQSESYTLHIGLELRKLNIKTIIPPGEIKVKKAFNFAENKGCKLIAFIGDNEVNNKTIQIKNMKTKEQTTIRLKDLIKIKDLLN